MLYVFWGADGFTVRQELNKMKASLGQPDMAGLNCVESDGSSLSHGELASLVQTMPFLAEKRLVIVHGLLAPFEPRQKPGSPEDSRETDEGTSAVGKKDASMAPALEVLLNVPPTTDLVLVEAKVSQRNPLFAKVPKDAVMREFPVPAGAGLESWITQRATGLGGSLSPAAARLLAENVGPDLWALDSEVRKLLLYSGDETVSEADVRLLVSHVREASVFALVDAVMTGRATGALLLTHQLMDGGTSPFQLLGLIARQVRLMLQAKDMAGDGLSHQNMAGVLGFRSPWAAKKLAQQAAGYTYDRLAGVYRRLVDEDLALKTGRRTPELGLDLLVVELCSGLRPAPR